MQNAIDNKTAIGIIIAVAVVFLALGGFWLARKPAPNGATASYNPSAPPDYRSHGSGMAARMMGGSSGGSAPAAGSAPGANAPR